METKLRCPRQSCRHEWTYKGKGTWYTSCPRCRTSVKVERKEGEQSPSKPINKKGGNNRYTEYN